MDSSIPIPEVEVQDAQSGNASSHSVLVRHPNPEVVGSDLAPATKMQGAGGLQVHSISKHSLADCIQQKLFAAEYRRKSLL